MEELIHEICRQYNINNYTINPDGSIDVEGDVDLSDQKLTQLPLNFRYIYGNFDCSNNELTSFEGSPKEVNGGFYCINNQLTSFKFAPKIVRGNFDCSYNNIKTFEFAPSFVRNYFNCWKNPIYWVWVLFEDWTKIDLLNDCDIFRDEETVIASIFIDRLNDFLKIIGKDEVETVNGYKPL